MAMFGLPGGMEWVIILAIVLLLFGPRNLPKLGKSLGKTMRGLREGMEGKMEDEDEDEEVATDNKAKAKAKPAPRADDEDEE